MTDLAPLSAPPMSQHLDHLVRWHADPLPGHPALPACVPDAVRREAAAAIMAAEAACQPAARAALDRWCGMLAAGVRNPPGEEDLEIRKEAILLALGDVPAGVFCPATVREALVAWQWWPSAADVVALLEPHATRLRRKLAALRGIALLPPAPPPAPEGPSEAERAEMADKLAGLRAEIIGRMVIEPRPSAGPKFLPPHVLLAGYEQSIAKEAPGRARDALIYRAEMLRKQLGKIEGERV